MIQFIAYMALGLILASMIQLLGESFAWGLLIGWFLKTLLAQPTQQEFIKDVIYRPKE